jgi:hypothetical protein
MKAIKPRRKSVPKRAGETEVVCLTRTAPARSPVEIDPLLLAALDETRTVLKKTERGSDGFPEADPADSTSLLEA